MRNQLYTTECRCEWLANARGAINGVATQFVVPHICKRPKGHSGPCECVCGATDDE